MIQLIRNRIFFFLPVICFILIAVSLVYLYPDGRSFFIINGTHAEFTDVFFKYATHIGDGLTAVILFVLLILFFRIGAGFWGLLGLAAVGIASFVMKYYLFPKSPRPHHYFWGNKMIHYVDDVKTLIENSFPSGHTFTAFFLFTYLSLMTFTEGILIQLIFAMLAIISGYSRVYLAQHFIGDILTGAVLGIIFAMVFYGLYYRTRKTNFFRSSLIGLFRK